MLTPTGAARLKGMALNKFKHHIAKDGAPEPILFGVDRFKVYDRREIEAWKPNVQPQKRRKSK